MSEFAVGVESEKAQIFTLKTTGIEKSHLERGGADPKSHSSAEHFFHELALKLKNANHILLMGPGLAKNHFKTHLEKHHHEGIAKKIIGVENSDHPTDNQILATVRKFFVKYDLFNSPIIPG